MAQLGTPKTRKFQIGTSEVRLGPMSMANKLTQAHSIGLLDSVTVEISQESVDLEGGFPKEIVDTAIIRQAGNVTANYREYSRRNINIALGNGVGSVEPTDVATVLQTAATLGATSLSVKAGDGAKIKSGDILVVYPDGEPEKLSIVRAESVATDVVTLNAGTPTLFPYAVGAKIYVSHALPIGAVQTTNYMALQLVQQERSSGRPVVFNFWKVAVGGGMSLQQGSEQFAASDLQLKILKPAQQEFVTGDLAHLLDLAGKFPTGMYAAGADS